MQIVLARETVAPAKGGDASATTTGTGKHLFCRPHWDSIGGDDTKVSELSGSREPKLVNLRR
jgi:hypothetical protein